MHIFMALVIFAFFFVGKKKKSELLLDTAELCQRGFMMHWLHPWLASWGVKSPRSTYTAKVRGKKKGV